MPTDLSVNSFPYVLELESFLDSTPLEKPGHLVRIAKKSSGVPSVSYADAVEALLCFGWIPEEDLKHDIQARWLRCTPRTAKSRWTKGDASLVARLEKEGRLRAAGTAAADAAKKDGRWERALAIKRRNMISAPACLIKALIDEPGALKNFKAMKGSQRRYVSQCIVGVDDGVHIISVPDQDRPDVKEVARNIARDASLTRKWNQRQQRKAKATAGAEVTGTTQARRTSGGSRHGRKSNAPGRQAKGFCSASKRYEAKSAPSLEFSHVEIFRRSNLK